MIKIGIVGAGSFAKTHANSIAKVPGCKITAVSSRTEAHAKEFAETYDCVYCTDYRDIHKIAEVDVVILNLPHNMHCEVGCYFLENKINVFVEKPMAMNVAECDKMIKLAKENGVSLVVGHVQQYTDAHKILKKMIDDQELGKLLRVTEVRDLHYFTPKRMGWHLKKETAGGGMFANFGAHSYDKLFYLTGASLADVRSVCTNTINDFNVEEGAQVLGKLDNGVSFAFSYTGSEVPAHYETYFYFEKGVAKVLYSTELFVYKDGEWKQLTDDTYDMHDKAIVALVDHLEGRESDITTAEHGRKVVEAIERTYENSL